jgi:indolepyruvate ferredoxin oxidoreductase beta subunit
MTNKSSAKAIKIVIAAMGGQGGGVLATWLAKLGEDNGYLAQTTSVPGVAQRTGATIYYVEFFPDSSVKKEGKAPVLALMPTPGDVDLVIAAELAEAGRAITRGFITDKTVVVASTHRDFSIAEKSAMSDGRLNGSAILDVAQKRARHLVEGDMLSAANDAGAAISAVLFGAVAGSGALPFERASYEQQIRNMGRAVEINLLGFSRGLEIAQSKPRPSEPAKREQGQSNEASPRVAPLIARYRQEIPAPAQYFALEGLKRVVDFQDIKYANRYLDRLKNIVAIDRAAGGETRDWKLTQAAAKHLALWMAYDDAVRVADLKSRASRFDRVREDVRVEEKQIFHVFEYMHPRVEEICDILPASLGGFILRNRFLRRALKRVLGNGKRVATTKLSGFLPLYFLSLLRPLRPVSLRFGIEQQRIDGWMETIKDSAERDYDLALELAKLQRLIKGYGDTHERGLRNFSTIMSALPGFANEDDAAATLSSLAEAALADEEGQSLQAAINSRAAQVDSGPALSA